MTSTDTTQQALEDMAQARVGRALQVAQALRTALAAKRCIKDIDKVTETLEQAKVFLRIHGGRILAAQVPGWIDADDLPGDPPLLDVDLPQWATAYLACAPTQLTDYVGGLDAVRAAQTRLMAAALTVVPAVTDPSSLVAPGPDDLRIAYPSGIRDLAALVAGCTPSGLPREAVLVDDSRRVWVLGRDDLGAMWMTCETGETWCTDEVTVTVIDTRIWRVLPGPWGAS